MPGEDIYSWSTTAASNDDADTLINWREGQTRASVNDSSRSEMAAHAKQRNLLTGTITTGGTANAQTFTSGVGYTVVPTGMRVLLKMGFTNTATATLNMDSIGAVTIKNRLGGTLGGGELILNAYTEFVYDGTNWILLTDAAGVVLLAKQTASASATIDFTGLSSAYDEHLVVFSGVVPSVAGLLYLRVSTDNGATFISTGTYNNILAEHPQVTGTGNMGVTVITAATQIQMANMDSSDAAKHVAGNIRLFGIGAAIQTQILYEMAHYHVANFGQIWTRGTGVNTTAATINAIRIFPSTGTLTTGNFALYGFRK